MSTAAEAVYVFTCVGGGSGVGEWVRFYLQRSVLQKNFGNHQALRTLENPADGLTPSPLLSLLKKPGHKNYAHRLTHFLVR